MTKFKAHVANFVALAVATFALGSLAVAAVASYYGYNPVTGLETFHGTFVTGGNQPVLSGCATVSASVGGAAAGKFVTSGTSCDLVITFPSAAPNGWTCRASDLTTVASSAATNVHQTASTTTTATFAGTTVAADVIQYSCVGF